MHAKINFRAGARTGARTGSNTIAAIVIYDFQKKISCDFRDTLTTYNITQ